MTNNNVYHSQRSSYLRVQSYDHLRKFLNKVSFMHNFFFHNTTFDSLASIVKYGTWKLSSASETNDLQEFNEKGDNILWRKIFSASFSHGDEDNIGMWKMYAKNDFRKSICIQLDKKFIKKWFCELKKTRKCYIENDHDGLIEEKFENVSFHDIVYVHGKQFDDELRICWGNMIRDPHRMRRTYRGQDDKDNKNYIETAQFLTGYLKNSAWEQEKESRMMIISKECDTLKNIFIKIPKAEFLESIKVRFNPFCYNGPLHKLSKNEEDSLLNEQIRLLDNCFDENGITLPQNLKDKCRLSYFTGLVKQL